MERSYGVPFSDLPQVLKDNLVPDPRRVYVKESPRRSVAASTTENKMSSARVSVNFGDGRKAPTVFVNDKMLLEVSEVHVYKDGRINIVKDGQRLVAKGSELVPEDAPGQLPAQDDEPEVNLGKVAADVARYFEASDEDRYEDWPQRW